MPAIYALLVGINNYPFKPLQGCINDVDAMEAYLKTSYPDGGKVKLSVTRLTDTDTRKPTRQNLIDAFTVFDAAEKGDTCLFYYSGHGSFSPAPPDLDNNGRMTVQSFVCLDSRDTGGTDLMDKEMAFLIWRAFQQRPEVHFVAITDCCHSGTITKAITLSDNSGVADRMASPGVGHVPDSIKNYLGGGDNSFYDTDSTGLYSAKQTQHIHLAASQNNQTSKELIIEGKTRGAFTWALLKTLASNGGRINYKDLLNKSVTLVKNLVSDQRPTINLNGGLPASEKDKLFLSQEVVGRTKSPDVLGVANQPISISFADDLPAAQTALLRAAYTPASFPFIRLTSGAGQYILRPSNTEVALTLPGSDRPVFKPAPVTNPGDAVSLLDDCDKVGNWKNLLELTNPAKALNGRYRIQLYRTSVNPAGVPGPEEEVVEPAAIVDFFSRFSNNHWDQSAFRLKITNTGATDLYITTVYLGFDYRLTPDSFPEIQLSPNNSTWLKYVADGAENDVIPLQIDEEYKELGYQEITEYLKLFIGTEKIDTSDFTQDGVRLSPVDLKVASKGIGMRGNKIDTLAWATETLGFRIIEPSSETALTPGRVTSLGEMVIGAHPSLTGTASLTSSALTARSADGVAPPNAANGNMLLEPFDLMPGTRSDAATDVLELFGVTNPDVVTADNPLIISLAAAPDDVWPIGYDSETGLYYPLGRPEADGTIRIETLPAETASDAAITQRSLLGSIKLYFQKVIGEKLGLPVKEQRLALPSLVNDKVSYNDDVPTVSAAVAAAKKILLFVHGIIGDTEGMVKCIDTPVDEIGMTLKKRYDLILTFDYENLNTPISETAVRLKEKLEAVGLKAGHGKELVIAAHSMGGMVSRWMIEKEGGNIFVTRLVMLGTPNNGTPWADVRDLAETLLTYAINGAAFLKPYLFILSLVGKALKGTQETLKEMDIKTGIYPQLNSRVDPKIPYRIVVGNTRAIIVKYDETAGLIKRLFVRVKKKGLYDTLDLVLFHKPNDIAVTDDSIGVIPGTDAWAVAPTLQEVACDHLNYFKLLPALENLL